MHAALSVSPHHTVSPDQRLLTLDAHSFSFVSPITEGSLLHGPIVEHSVVRKLAFRTTERFSLGPQLGLRACLHGGGGPQVGEVTRLAVVEKWLAFTCKLTTPGSRGDVTRRCYV